MNLKEVRDILHAQVLCGEELLDTEVRSACGSDFMKCIVFVRGKQPDEGILELARDRQLVVLATKERMYNACGLLYINGLRE